MYEGGEVRFASRLFTPSLPASPLPSCLFKHRSIAPTYCLPLNWLSSVVQDRHRGLSLRVMAAGDAKDIAGER